MTIPSGWEASDAGRDGGFARTSLLNFPGGDAAGAFSLPSSMRPRGRIAECGGLFLVNRLAYRGRSAGADALDPLSSKRGAA